MPLLPIHKHTCHFPKEVGGMVNLQKISGPGLASAEEVREVRSKYYSCCVLFCVYGLRWPGTSGSFGYLSKDKPPHSQCLAAQKFTPKPRDLKITVTVYYLTQVRYFGVAQLSGSGLGISREVAASCWPGL